MSYSFVPANNTSMIHQSMDLMDGAARKGPTRDDWERHRPFIKRLYVDEGKELKEVMAIMKQYGHSASPKMYKDRIKKWGLDKKNKEQDMVAILRKKTEREAIGKDTKFRVRGHMVTLENVLHYFKRKKGIQDIRVFVASTPSDISCWTPSPVHTPRPVDYDTQMISMDHGSLETPFGGSLPLAPANNDKETGVVITGCTHAPPFIDDEDILQSTVNDIYTFFPDHSSIPYQPSAPQTLLVPDRLVFSIKTYFDHCFETGTWTTDEYGQCTTIGSAAKNDLSDLNNFLNYCYMAAYFVYRGLYLEFRRTLSKACHLIEGILRAEHPRTLEYFLDVFCFFIQRGFPEPVFFLRDYVNKMVTNIFLGEHPWGRIHRLLSMLDAEALEQAISQSWKCIIDAFDKSLGSFNMSTMDTQLRFVNLVQGGIDLVEQENLLRGLITKYEIFNISTRKIHNAKLVLGYNMGEQQRYRESEELGVDLLSRAQQGLGDEKIAQKVEALELISIVQYLQHKRNSAEKNLRDAIATASDQWGLANPSIIRNMTYLEGWLREWGRREEADRVREKRSELVGRDEIDEQMAEE